MLRFLFKAYRLFIKKVFEPIGHVVGRIYLSGNGVLYEKNIKLYGMPTVSVSNGSVIKIGSNTVLRSLSRGNAIGVNHEIILRTSTTTAKIIIGDGFRMSGGAICAVNKVQIGNGVMVGANVVIADNDFHGMTPETRSVSSEQIESRPVVIHDGVWIGADVYVCKGVTIGKNSVIGAKAVVTKPIPANCIAVGIPAKVIGKIK